MELREEALVAAASVQVGPAGGMCISGCGLGEGAAVWSCGRRRWWRLDTTANPDPTAPPCAPLTPVPCPPHLALALSALAPRATRLSRRRCWSFLAAI